MHAPHESAYWDRPVAANTHLFTETQTGMWSNIRAMGHIIGSVNVYRNHEGVHYDSQAIEAGKPLSSPAPQVSIIRAVIDTRASSPDSASVPHDIAQDLLFTDDERTEVFMHHIQRMDRMQWYAGGSAQHVQRIAGRLITTRRDVIYMDRLRASKKTPPKFMSLSSAYLGHVFAQQAEHIPAEKRSFTVYPAFTVGDYYRFRPLGTDFDAMHVRIASAQRITPRNNPDSRGRRHKLSELVLRSFLPNSQ